MPEAALRNAVQAALFAADAPLSLDDLGRLFGARDRPPRAQLAAAIEELAAECAGRGYSLVRVASGWRYQIDQDYAGVIGRLWAQRPPRYSQALLETLALIAYRQPITRGEIAYVRGVEPSTSVMQTLTERGWVRAVGHKQTPGRPALYGTTREFLDYFGLKSLKQLPPLPEAPDPATVAALPAQEAAAASGEAPAETAPAEDVAIAPDETPGEAVPPEDAAIASGEVSAQTAPVEDAPDEVPAETVPATEDFMVREVPAAESPAAGADAAAEGAEGEAQEPGAPPPGAPGD